MGGSARASEEGWKFRVPNRNSQLATQILAQIWRQELSPPKFANANDGSSVSLQVVIYGGWRGWEFIPDLPQCVKEAAFWLSTPRQLWRAVISEVLREWRRFDSTAPEMIEIIPPDEEMGNRCGRNEIPKIPDLSGM